MRMMQFSEAKQIKTSSRGTGFGVQLYGATETKHAQSVPMHLVRSLDMRNS
jgi:hypothetical protein